MKTIYEKSLEALEELFENTSAEDLEREYLAIETGYGTTCEDFLRTGQMRDPNTSKRSRDMSNVKVGDWIVNQQVGDDLTVGKQYKVHSVHNTSIDIIDDAGEENEIYEDKFRLGITPQKYRNPPREEYRELCEAMLAGADLCQIDEDGSYQHSVPYGFFNLDVNRIGIDLTSILPQLEERKERIKKQLREIGEDKLAQLIIDLGVEL